MESNEMDLQLSERDETGLSPLLSTEAHELPDARGRRRVRSVRASSVSINRLAKSELELGRLLYPEVHVPRPATRAECAEGERPCPFVSCKYHLYLDVSPKTGAIKMNFPDLDVSDMAETCVLDVAERGDATVLEIAAVMNLSGERIRQVELEAFGRITGMDERAGLRQFDEDGPVRKRRLFLVEEPDDDEEVDEPPVEDLAHG
jgi:hypothetical protein